MSERIQCKHESCDATIYDNKSDYCSERCELEALNDNYNKALNQIADLQAKVQEQARVIDDITTAVATLSDKTLGNRVYTLLRRIEETKEVE